MCPLWPTSLSWGPFLVHGLQLSYTIPVYGCNNVRIFKCCEAWNREIWWKNQFWLVANTSQGCVDTIRFAQGVEGEDLWLLSLWEKMMFSRRQEVSSWYYRTAMDKDKLWQSGPQLHTGIGWRWDARCVAELGRWLKNFQEKPIWKLHHEFSARFRSVPRRNAWSGLIPSEYTFMVEYDSSLNYDCRYRQWQQRIVGVDNGSWRCVTISIKVEIVRIWLN